MSAAFFIFGYGVPKNIFKDENYNQYLKLAFNTIFDLAVKWGIRQPLVVFCGGRTDCFKPYHRTEAEEMRKLFQVICHRTAVRSWTTDWRLLTQTHALSTVENLLESVRLLKRKKFKPDRVFIFCEQTRSHRVRTLAKKIFGSQQKITVVPVDFDLSPRRYVDPRAWRKRERRHLGWELWALKNKKNLHDYREAYKEKLALMRATPVSKRERVMDDWFREKLKA